MRDYYKMDFEEFKEIPLDEVYLDICRLHRDNFGMKSTVANLQNRLDKYELEKIYSHPGTVKGMTFPKNKR